MGQSHVERLDFLHNVGGGIKIKVIVYLKYYSTGTFFIEKTRFCCSVYRYQCKQNG